MLLAGLLGAGTAALQLGPWRYQPAGAPAIDDFAEGAKPPWFATRRGATLGSEAGRPEITLLGGPRISYAARWIARPPAGGYSSVNLEYALDGVVADRRMPAVEILVASLDRNGRRIAYWPRALASGEGSAGWQRAHLVVPWRPEVAAMRLEIVHRGSAGTLRVRDVRLTPLADAAWYDAARAGLIVLWAALGAAALVAGLRLARPCLATAATGAAAAFVLVGGLLPEPLFHELAAPLEEPLQIAGRAIVGPATTPPRVVTAPQPVERPADGAPGETARPPAPLALPPSAETPPEVIERTREGALWLRRAIGRNVMHAAGFGGIGLLAAFVAPPVGLAHVAALAGFASVTETVQLFTITREASLEDVLIDLLGGLAGLAGGTVLRRLAIKLRGGSRNSGPPAPRRAR